MMKDLSFSELLEEEEKEHFSFEELSKYVGRPQRLQYLESSLNLLGGGSSRFVFDLKNGFALKAAISEIGVLQNETEYKLFHGASKTVKRALAKVASEYDENFEWIVMEKIQIFASEAEFKNALGLNQEQAKELLGNICFAAQSAEEIRQKIQSNIDYFENYEKKFGKKHQQEIKWKSMLGFTEQFAKLCLAVPYLESNGGDLGRLDQLGFDASGNVVIADYGFGFDTFAAYNPTPYQQAAIDAKANLYFDDDNRKEYDKYGNEIVKAAPKINKQNVQYTRPQNDDNNDGDYIPF